MQLAFIQKTLNRTFILQKSFKQVRKWRTVRKRHGDNSNMFYKKDNLYLGDKKAKLGVYNSYVGLYKSYVGLCMSYVGLITPR
jgi:hypothetical protein